MKIVFGIMLAVSLLAVVGAPAALAVEEPTGDFLLPTDSEVPGTGDVLLERIGTIGNWVFAILLAVSIIYIILAAFQFITGAGDPAKVTEARQKLIYSAIGIAIALLASGFDDILRSILV